MATPPFLPDETKPGASDLISLFPAVEQTFRDVIEDWILVEHNTNGTHKQVTLDDIATPTIAANLVGLWHESGVLKTRFATGTVYDVLTTNTGMPLAGGTMTGDLVLSGAPDADLKAATKKYVDDADALKANLASPALTGNPTAPTQSAGNDSTRLATTAFVGTAIDAVITVKTAKATTSGGAQTYTGLAAGANRITVIFDSVSLSGTDDILIQLGISSGIVNSGYVSKASDTVAESTSHKVTSTSGFITYSGNAGAGNKVSGRMTLLRVTGNVWVSDHVLHGTAEDVNSSGVLIGAGRKSLSAELTQVRVTRTGSNTFDNGQINIFVE